jgi:hypothetical protein
MFSGIQPNEMAETLSILAGPNASNAARAFSKESLNAGDIATAAQWSNIAATLEYVAVGPQAEAPVPPVPRRMIRLREQIAFQDASFEDVDAETLAREELGEDMAAREAMAQPAEDVGRAHDRAAPAMPAQRLAWLRPRLIEPGPVGAAKRPARPVWSRLLRQRPRRIAA